MPLPPRGRDAAVLVSGGVDSAVLTVDLLAEHSRVFPIYVRFGLRWEPIELDALRSFLQAAGATRPGLMPLTVLDDPIAGVYGDHWSNTGQFGIPGSETDDSAVYLPGRNVLLATKASVWCRLRDIETLAFGTLGSNPFPDAGSGFFQDLEAVLNRAMDGRLRIIRPYSNLHKSDVLRRAAHLPLHLTLSCLDPAAPRRHCGACNKCAERRRAFQQAGILDQTDYLEEPILTP
jgi:7-cyano-7-deazaguanine synthase